MGDSFLSELLGSTRARVDEARSKITPEALEQRCASAAAPKGFEAALRVQTPALVAEIKRASPAKGPLAPDLNAGELARAYAAAGAAAISVLTEPDLFLGSLEDLEAATAAGPPVLRKDFVIDTFQVLESRAAGADAVLVIVKVLGEKTAEMARAIRAMGMDALVEVHDEGELEIALDAGATTIGVNHRDLETFEVDPERTAKLAPLVPPDVVLMGLSGVSRRSEVEELVAAGASAVLVGESLVTASDPAAKLRELIGG